MSKSWIFLLLIQLPLLSFEKLDSKYLVEYGAPDAKSHAVEYFSLSCPKCIDFFLKEFPSIKSQYIDSGSLFWTFHPDPADLLTLQAMVCLDRLSPEQKPLFFETIMKHLAKRKNKTQSARLLQIAMEALNDPQPALEDLDFLQLSQAFQDAFAFVSQEDAIQVIPSLEIDGHLYKELPSAALIQTHINPTRPS